LEVGVRACRPDILAACEGALVSMQADGDLQGMEKSAFAACPSDSIDYGVMEKLAAGTAGLPKVHDAKPHPR
jgi:mannose-1-phosphate guanylyltransferase / mannose-6-phosphate isomerase